MFTFFVVPVTMFVASQITACRTEEATGRLEIALAGPIDRRRWLVARSLVAAVGGLTVAMAAALLTWAGTAIHGHAVPLTDMLKAGLNCLPVALSFYALGVITWAIWPRWTATVAFGSVVVAFLLQLIGALVKAPAWVLDLSPFHHFAPAPAEPINGGAAVAMIVLFVASVAVGAVLFRRRDLAPA
jgi:ABC-2 type transport system permease protein